MKNEHLCFSLLLVFGVLLPTLFVCLSDHRSSLNILSWNKNITKIKLKKESKPSSDSDRFIIVSADGRWPRVFDSSPENSTFYEWASLINLAYAEKQGYDFIFYVFNDNNTGTGCSHRVFGRRYMAWCKLVALQKTLSLLDDDYATILWMDSDSSWVRQDLSLTSFINQTGLGCSNAGYDKLKNESRFDTGCRSSKCNRLKESASFLFFANRPFCDEAIMSGNFLMKSTESARRALSWWWNLNACSDEFPWEQRAANNYLYPNLYGQQGGVEILSTSHNYFPGTNEAVRHHGHSGSSNVKRAQEMRRDFRLAGLDEERDFARLASMIQKRIVSLELDELKSLGDSLTDLTWDKALDKPDTSWMIRRPYQDKQCPYLAFERPRYSDGL